MAWEGCKHWLDPAWTPQDSQDTISSATPASDVPPVMPNDTEDD